MMTMRVKLFDLSLLTVAVLFPRINGSAYCTSETPCKWCIERVPITKCRLSAQFDIHSTCYSISRMLQIIPLHSISLSPQKKKKNTRSNDGLNGIRLKGNNLCVYVENEMKSRENLLVPNKRFFLGFLVLLVANTVATHNKFSMRINSYNGYPYWPYFVVVFSFIWPFE